MTRKLTLFFVCAFEIGLILFVAAWPVGASEQRVRQIINESIASYPGKCACPYSLMSNGRKCGKRSAYSKPGGYEPLCYPDDVYRKYPSLKSAGNATGLYIY